VEVEDDAGHFVVDDAGPPMEDSKGTPLRCMYRDGVSAPDGQWWSDGFGIGWDPDRPGSSWRAGTVTNLTCAPGQLAGQGSMPPDHCSWKYLCVPAGS
jgi:hypothetical protein